MCCGNLGKKNANRDQNKGVGAWELESVLGSVGYDAWFVIVQGIDAFERGDARFNAVKNKE
jgi:hypothetical protein